MMGISFETRMHNIPVALNIIVFNAVKFLEVCVSLALKSLQNNPDPSMHMTFFLNLLTQLTSGIKQDTLWTGCQSITRLS